ncbi:MAG: hypothetical protein V1661_00950 [bacterium]
MLNYLVSAAIIAAIISILIKLGSRRKRLPEYKETKEKWEEIEALIKNDSGLSWRLAVIEADKLMDSALKEARMRGETMGERLRFAASKYPKIHKVWEAHILRNNLVHERDSEINKSEAKKALDVFKEGLKVLGAL